LEVSVGIAPTTLRFAGGPVH